MITRDGTDGETIASIGIEVRRKANLAECGFTAYCMLSTRVPGVPGPFRSTPVARIVSAMYHNARQAKDLVPLFSLGRMVIRCLRESKCKIRAPAILVVRY